MHIIITGSRELEYNLPFVSTMQVECDRLLQNGCTAPMALKLARQKAQAHVVRDIHAKLDELNAELTEAGSPIDCVIHGGARGVDRTAGSWAQKHGIAQRTYIPRWELPDGTVDKQAGFKRNWRMVFCEAGPAVAKAFDKQNGCVVYTTRRIAKLVAQALRIGDRKQLAKMVRWREVLKDSRHPERRDVLKELGIPVPYGVIVVAFHDGDSRGTDHCVMAAQHLGYETVRHTYKRPEQQLTFDRINHRSDDVDRIPLGEAGPRIS